MGWFGKDKDKKAKTKKFSVVCAGVNRDNASKRGNESFEAPDDIVSIMQAAVEVAVRIVMDLGIKDGYYTVCREGSTDPIGKGEIRDGTAQSADFGKK